MRKQLGFSPEESAKLELASNMTREMIQIELAAMEAVERGGGSKESSLQALYMLTDEAYLATKTQIINLIDETQSMVHKRTRLAMEKTLRQTEGFFLLLLSAVVAFAASASALFWLEKRRSSKLEKSSYHDPLTKLANRAYLDLYLKLVTSKAKTDGEVVVLAFLDLNGFKGINDIFGHAQGDFVLKIVAKGLLAHVREKDLIARYGGDEFVVVFVAPAAHREQTLTRMKKALHSAFKQLATDIQNIKVGAAVGISVYPRPATSITMLLRTADQAMYAAKGTDNLLTVREY
jgi:diguanylate cyclase (GGDEF)-like protein